MRACSSAFLPSPRSSLFQFGVFGFRLFKDGDVRVSVFPKGQEILVGGAGLGQGIRLWGRPLWVPGWGGQRAFPRTGLEGISAAQAEVRQRTQRAS